MHVFISYSHANGDFAEILRTRLEGSGFNVWTDEDRLVAGEDWRNGIDKAVRSACALIVVMTPSAKASEYVTYEWAFASGVGVKVIPILLEPTPLHPRLEVLQYLDFSIRSARPWDKLLALLKEVSANSRTGSPRDQEDVESSTPRIVRNVLSTLDNVDSDIRVKAVEMLASMQHPAARDAVVNALKHPMSDVRGRVAEALGEIKDAAAIPPLIEALRDEDSAVRGAAARALGEIKDAAAVPPLIEALRDKDSTVREAASWALTEINK
jgi:HEAT repeat protein